MIKIKGKIINFDESFIGEIEFNEKINKITKLKKLDTEDLIIPGFMTDIIGFLLIFPISRKFIFNKISKKYQNKENLKKKDYIEGDFEDIEDEHDRKL